MHQNTRMLSPWRGQMPRTRSGFKYVLTCMCYASKYPDAVPMKRADAKAIAEAMMEKISRTGLPDEILTDKGPFFVGELGGGGLISPPNGCINSWHWSCVKCTSGQWGETCGILLQKTTTEGTTLLGNRIRRTGSSRFSWPLLCLPYRNWVYHRDRSQGPRIPQHCQDS